jgi:hypothetical protein
MFARGQAAADSGKQQATRPCQVIYSGIKDFQGLTQGCLRTQAINLTDPIEAL